MQRILEHVKPERRNKEFIHNPTHAIFWQRPFHFETVEQFLSMFIPWIVPALKLSGFYERGQRNAAALRTTRLTICDPRLPRSFDGFRLLFMSDLHIDGNDAVVPPLCAALDAIDADVCLLGGDYRFQMRGEFRRMMDHFHEFVPHIRCKEGVVGILGNHDSWEMIKPFERLGIVMLINEAVNIERGGERIWILGVDDPHYYRCDDYHKANRRVPERAFRILLAHSTNALRKFTNEPINLYLCGHTHAGQISVPFVGPVITHSPLKGAFIYGRWQYRHIPGYTSSGVGTSGVNVRYNTWPEVVVITLQRGASKNC